ncbi:MAG: hypothetical protein HY808_12515 [Nitrospirae bacterium]|nr:hypothetical protein [Nitrospirota bacterium]
MTISIFTQNKMRNVETIFSVCLLAVVFFCALLILPSETKAANWQVTLWVKAGTADNRLVLGADDTATDGYDSIWDTYALLGGGLEAYFSHPEWNMIHDVFQRDIRSHTPGATKTWSFAVNSTLADTNFTITWDASTVPVDYPLSLFDSAAGQSTDMHSTGFYNFAYSGTRTFQVSVTECNLPVRIAGAIPNYFTTLQAAYNAAADGDTIQIMSTIVTEDINMNLNKSVILEGGYDCAFTSNTGTTIFTGIMTLSNGIVTIGNLMLQ